jgi:hypothetical protein
MMPYIVTGHDGNPKQKVAFGVIQRMFKHCITEGAASRILLEVDWFDTGGNEFDGEMPCTGQTKSTFAMEQAQSLRLSQPRVRTKCCFLA